MSVVSFQVREGRRRMGFKGPRAAEWLTVQGVTLPEAANTWTSDFHAAMRSSDAHAQGRPATAGGQSLEVPRAELTDRGLLVARLGASEFFLESDAGEAALARMFAGLENRPSGVYPVLREDAAFLLSGAAAHDVLAQVCNVNFAALDLETNPVIMTLMIGVAVLVVPQAAGTGRRYLIWCDPTFGAYVEDALASIVKECGEG